MHEIDIYGDIVAFKSVKNNNEYDLQDLNNALSELKINDSEELVINIHSHGGETTTAFGIYQKLRNFKHKNNISITTRIDGWCASSAVIILLAVMRKIEALGFSYLEVKKILRRV